MKEKSKNQIWIEKWLAFGRENLLFAKSGMNAAYKPYRTVSFFCRDSTEKYLKGYLISNGWELEKIHDLKKLVGYARQYDPSFAEMLTLADLLNAYLDACYPPFEAIGEEQAREAIEAAEKIERFVLQKMAASEHNDSEE